MNGDTGTVTQEDVRDVFAAFTADAKETLLNIRLSARRCGREAVALNGTSACLSDGLTSLQRLQKQRAEVGATIRDDDDASSSDDSDGAPSVVFGSPAAVHQPPVAQHHRNSSNVPLRESDKDSGTVSGTGSGDESDDEATVPRGSRHTTAPAAADAQREADANGEDVGSDEDDDEADDDAPEDDIGDAEAEALLKRADGVERAARMEELRQAMGVKQLRRRLLRGLDEVVDHPWDKPSAGVTFTEETRKNDKWPTHVVWVAENAHLRLGPRSRNRAQRAANATIGVKHRKIGPSGRLIDPPSTKAVRNAGKAAHAFAKEAQLYFTGGITGPPHVFDFGQHFSRLHSSKVSLREKFEGIARPYRDAIVEGVLFLWDEFEAMTEEQFEKALKLVIENGSKGPYHSKDNAKAKTKGAAGSRKRKAGSAAKGRKKKRRAMIIDSDSSDQADGGDGDGEESSEHGNEDENDEITVD